jgi:putative hemolysin
MEEILVISICLILNAFLAAYEMAFVTVSKGALRQLAREGNRDALRLFSLRENPERTLSIIQIGITVVGVLSSAVGGAGASESIEPYFRNRFGLGENTAELIAILLVVFPLTYLNVVVGELTPKSIALRNPLKISLRGAKWLFVADRILAPAVDLLEWSTKQILRPFRSKTPTTSASTETAVDIDALPLHHQQAVLNLAHLETRRVKDILLPWENVDYIKVSDSMESVVPVIFASGHTRLPVVDESGAVIGILHTKECLALRETGNKDWKAIVRPILVIQPQESTLSILRQMQKNKSHMAVVMAGKELPEGIVTFEDISEEIWGDLYDEDEDSRIRKIFADRVKAKIRSTSPNSRDLTGLSTFKS